ncbi:CheR methyltransferase SAM-binding domain-containing protein [Corallococcus coralloides DSM 2259]|uniref:protein-glutamate O-methyltransferase n=1 Tax=Corallococcus coralloides (strain ATCC 25202 / DSM 2259 / NBRC 100086 / M2) TaxID=1144275 RepID=H8MFY3_CORCM|nr:CheR family methyltransferase [Corallococcus coralloides]AFE08315.1 CheR methyltransferase SAM-binding domain-containing protein [Corallococcus coralloides DSM 2259]
MATKPPRDSELEAILEKVRQVRNFDFRNYKRATLQRRIERRMQATRCRSRTAYLALLERDPTEVSTLVSSMLIKLTSFFRDKEVWQALEQSVAELVRQRPDAELRIWSAGCATGEEAYSLAIIAAEAMGPGYPGAELKVFGTDVDEDAIATARRGIYSPEQLENVSPERLARFFVRTGNSFTVRKEIRRAVVFGVNNLVSDAPVSRIDIILCRNVFIYLDSELQKRVLARFQFALRRNGLMVLGRSELIPFAARLFRPIDLARRIYRRDGQAEVTSTTQDRLPPEPSSLPRILEPSMDFERSFLRNLLDSHPCPHIATDNDGTVTLWSRAAARLWNRNEGEMLGKKLATLGLPGLSGDLLVEQSQRVRSGNSEREVADGLMEISNGDPVALRIQVVPLREAAGGRQGLLYIVHDISHLRGMEQNLRAAQEELQAMQLRMQSSTEELRASNEELETTNEELQSANEELQTTNEELQSTNEELETTNEELQSANSELDATNRELAHRTLEMDALTFCQRTIIRTLSAAVLVLDGDGRITTWNLAAERLLGLTERETVGQLLWSLHVPALKRALLLKLRRHLKEKRSLRMESIPYQLPHGGKGSATLVATPLITDTHVLGSIILFEDTTRATALLEENRSLQEKLKA